MTLGDGRQTAAWIEKALDSAYSHIPRVDARAMGKTGEIPA